MKKLLTTLLLLSSFLGTSYSRNIAKPSGLVLPNVDYASIFFQKLGTVDYIRKVTALPTSCTAVGSASSSNAVLYQGRVYFCTSTDTWTATLTSASGVSSITGTANQVIASAATGAITLSLPQSIGTGSSPTFTGLTLSGATNARILYSASGVITTTAGFDFSAVNGLQTTGVGAGTSVTNMTGLSIVNSSATTNNFAGINFIDTIAGGASGSWGVRMTNRTSHYGDAVFALRSAAGYLERFSIVPESAATFSTVDVAVATAGKSLQIKTGSNACSGTAVLSGGTVTVSTTCTPATIGTNGIIQLTSQVDGGTPGWLRVSTVTGSTSFVITSSSGTDTSTVGWTIIKHN